MAKIISLRLRRLLRLLRLGQIVAISQQPLEEETGAGSRDGEIEEEKGGPGAGLQSYVEKPNSRQDPFRDSIWLDKSINLPPPPPFYGKACARTLNYCGLKNTPKL